MPAPLPERSTAIALRLESSALRALPVLPDSKIRPLPAVTLEILADALCGVELAGAAVVLRLLPEIHERYVCAVAAPSAAATASAAVRPAP